MSDTVETVKVVSDATPSGYMIINKSKLKESDQIYGVDKPKTRKPKTQTET